MQYRTYSFNHIQQYGGYEKSCMTLSTLYRGSYGTMICMTRSINCSAWGLGSRFADWSIGMNSTRFFVKDTPNPDAVNLGS